MQRISTHKVLFGLSIVFIGIHLLSLTQIPYFEDEALFTGWSKEIAAHPLRFTLPLQNGIAPLFSWLVALISVFVSNQFFAGRLISVVAGLGLWLVVGYTLKQVFKTQFSLFWLVVLIFFPMTLVYNRLALLEPLLVFFITSCVVIAYQFLLKPSRGKICFFSLILGCALLTKQIGLLIIPAVVIASFLVEKRFSQKILVLIGASIVALIVSSLFFLPFRGKSVSFLADYIIVPLSNGWFAVLKQNMWLTYYWLRAYYPLTLLCAAVVGMVLILKRREKLSFFVIVFFVLSGGILATDFHYFPRHTLVFAPFILLFAAALVQHLATKKFAIAVLLCGLVSLDLLFKVVPVLTHPEVPGVLAREDTFQFYEDWTSGRLLPDIAAAIADKANQGQITGIFVDSSLYYYGLPLFLPPTLAIYMVPPTFAQLQQSLNKNGVTMVIENRGIPYQIQTAEKTLWHVSSRHVVTGYLLTQ